MNNRNKELQIVTIDEDLKREIEINSYNEDEFRELFKRYYELEITRLDKEYESIAPTVH